MQLHYEVERNVHSFQQVSEPHFHDGYEILICLSDGGRFQIQQSEYPLCRAMMFVLPQRVLHRCIVDIASYDRYILHFSEEALWLLSSSQTDLRGVFNSSSYYTVLTGEQLARLGEMLDGCLENHAEFGGDLQKNILFMQIILLISQILRNDTQSAPPTPSREFSKILPVIEYIHNHYTDELSLDGLSRLFFISKYHLCRRFKAATGFGINAYIANYRIRQACSLLRGGASVQDAGEQAGFRSNAHFIRTFGQILGVSPGKYVKSLQFKK